MLNNTDELLLLWRQGRGSGANLRKLRMAFLLNCHSFERVTLLLTDNQHSVFVISCPCVPLGCA